MSGARWGHASSLDAETWTGAYSTREEAIEHGRREYDGPFFVTRGSRIDPAEFMPSADELIEMAGERAADECGVEDWPDLSDQAVRELDDLLEAWARKHAQLDWWRAEGVPERIEHTPAAEVEAS